MNGPEAFRPSPDYTGSLSAGACLGGCTGSLYLALLSCVLAPTSKILAFAIVMSVATALSTPFLYWLSLLAGPLLSPWLIRIHRGRLPLFTFVGGGVGIIVGLALLAVWFLLRRPAGPPDFQELIRCLIFVTVPFAYGAAWGTFTALAMGNADRKYMNHP